MDSPPDTRILANAADFIRDNRESLVSIWETKALSRVDSAEDVTKVKLRNHLVELLNDLHHALRQIDDGNTARRSSKDQFTLKWSEQHGLSRAAEEDYTAYEVAKEYVILRQVVTDQLAKQGLNTLRCVEAINSMFELASLSAIRSFTQAENRTRENLVATLVHDIRSPLSSAIFGLDLLGKHPDNKKLMSELYPVIQRSNRRALQMITSLLDEFSNDEKQGLTLSFEETDLVPIFREALEDMGHVYQGKLEYEITSDRIEGIFARDMLLRTLENLISNAFKHGSTNTPIKVLLEERGELVALSVHNLGNPIPEEKKKEIFTIFKTQNRSDKIAGWQGWGLGLTHVKLVAIGHGGEVSLTSTEAEGTTFTLTFQKRHQKQGQKNFGSIKSEIEKMHFLQASK